MGVIRYLGKRRQEVGDSPRLQALQAAVQPDWEVVPGPDAGVVTFYHPLPEGIAARKVEIAGKVADFLGERDPDLVAAFGTHYDWEDSVPPRWAVIISTVAPMDDPVKHATLSAAAALIREEY